MSFRIYLTAAVLLFSLGIVFGVYSPPVSGLMTQEMSALKEWADRLAALPPALMAVFILLKNCFALLFSFAMSPLLGLVPVLTLAINGWLIGVVAVEVSNKVSLGYFLAGVLPHGIIEIPALMIGEAAALGFGVSVFYSIFRKNAPGYLAASFKKNFRYLIIAMLLLVPAALIETFITPLLLR
ncbi:MAG: stage II sporulation protein M [Chloroflexota bacterium]